MSKPEKNRNSLRLLYSRGGIGQTEEGMSTIIKDSYDSLSCLIDLQGRLREVKKQIEDEKLKNIQKSNS